MTFDNLVLLCVGSLVFLGVPWGSLTSGILPVYYGYSLVILWVYFIGYTPSILPVYSRYTPGIFLMIFFANFFDEFF